MFYLTYLDEGDQLESAFAQWGSLCHELLDRFARGELLAFELSDEYDRLYPEKMTERFPWNLWRDLDALYYDSGKAYFDSFEGLPGELGDRRLRDRDPCDDSGAGGPGLHRPAGP